MLDTDLAIRLKNMANSPIRVTAEIPVWGTVVWVEAFGNNEEALESGVADVRKYFESVDQLFSTYIETSEVSRLRRGELNFENCNPEVQEIWEKCLKAKEFTEGAFDPWKVTGGFDPSGYVKGWAADNALEILKEHCATSAQVNAAGDISLFGGTYVDGVHKPWSTGIRHPEDPKTIVKVFEIMDGAIATSGTYERGSHIIDPFTGTIAIGARSATVLGPDGGIAEALATALIVAGKDGAKWFTKPELAGYSAWVIERHSDQAWGINLK